MTTKFVAKSPLDMLAFIPVAMRFMPSESVAMLTFGGAQFHARLDLPSDTDEAKLAAQALLAPCIKHGVKQVVLAFYTEADHSPAWLAMRDAFYDANIKVIDALLVQNGRWDSLVGNGSGDADISNHPMVVQAIAETGLVLRPNRDALGDVLAARDTLEESWLPPAPDPDDALSIMAEAEMLATIVDDATAEGRILTSAELGTVLVDLPNGDLRDVIIKEIVKREDPREHMALWADATARAPHPYRAHAASLFALAAFMAGDGASGWIGVDLARAIDADNTMAGIVAGLLEQAIDPAFASMMLADLF